jgi:hypothetical protein
MKFVAVNTNLSINGHEVIYVNENEFYDLSLNGIDYVIVSGGDGLLRRIIQNIIFSGDKKPTIIIDAKGSFNVIAKKYFIPKIHKTIAKIEAKKTLKIRKHPVYKLNHQVFLFSAGNLHDALHIHLSEIFRVGMLKKGMLKYVLSGLFIIPIAVLTLPFLLFSKKRFFIFTPFESMNFMNLYTKVKHLKIDLKNDYNLLEIDGDLIILQDRFIEIKKIDDIEIVVG